MPELTPFQTTGPFFHLTLPFPGGDAIAPDVAGHRIAVEGRVIDGAGEPMPEALVEIWQSGVEPPCDGFGRVATDDDGRFAFSTVMPGRLAGPGGKLQAPHLAVGLLATGLLVRLVTRIYFEDEPSNQDDPILALVPEPRRPTLIATKLGPDRYRFDIVIQGANETVFFDV